MANKHAPFFPIIYVRGFAAFRGEIDETTADPFCGFNLGSTVLRAVPERDRKPRKFVFESTVIRLASDFGYEDVYEDGYDIVDPDWSNDKSNKLKSKSIIIFRYYDEASRLLGNAQTPEISSFSKELSDLIIKVRDLVCANKDNEINQSNFRCYLVGHSMGGLVCRGMLQNPTNDPHDAKQYVDKFFTYATPHDGIELGGFNVPAMFGNNFNRKNMSNYLNLKKEYSKTNSVAWIPPNTFPPNKVFCMVGTNRSDYDAVLGVSKTFAGNGSDGLVRIENATLKSINADGSLGEPCAKAFAYRSHSGYFGIVNSEESYQNLTRFLFGDVRVDIYAEIEEIRLPRKVQDAVDSGNEVNALYQIEVLASPRGKLWYLTRRMSDEDSVACITHKQFVSSGNKIKEYLSTVFLAKFARVNTRRHSLAYSLFLGIRVPDYEIDKKLWVNEHFEGSYLFRNSITIELVPPNENEEWKVKFGWQDIGFSLADEKIEPINLNNGSIMIEIPFDSKSVPGIKGRLIFNISEWNN